MLQARPWLSTSFLLSYFPIFYLFAPLLCPLCAIWRTHIMISKFCYRLLIAFNTTQVKIKIWRIMCQQTYLALCFICLLSYRHCLWSTSHVIYLRVYLAIVEKKIYIYIYICVYVYLYIYIYIWGSLWALRVWCSVY